MMLYNRDDLNILLRKTKRSFVFFIIFLSLAIISMASFILFSFYEMRVLFQIVGSLVSLLFVGLAIYFIDRNLFYKRVATEYLNILNEKGTTFNVKVTEFDKKVITLSDKSTVYEITCLDGKKSRVFYLSSLFEPKLVKDISYRIVAFSNYVKEYYEG